ncbi:hypothetical protein GCM10020331_060460 [Ectobacillus funiculus]
MAFLQGPVPQTTPDMKTAINSLKKVFLHLDIETVICYHGGLCNITEKKTTRKLGKVINVH